MSQGPLSETPQSSLRRLRVQVAVVATASRLLAVCLTSWWAYLHPAYNSQSSLLHPSSTKSQKYLGSDFADSNTATVEISHLAKFHPFHVTLENTSFIDEAQYGNPPRVDDVHGSLTALPRPLPAFMLAARRITARAFAPIPFGGRATGVAERDGRADYGGAGHGFPGLTLCERPVSSWSPLEPGQVPLQPSKEVKNQMVSGPVRQPPGFDAAPSSESAPPAASISSSSPFNNCPPSSYCARPTDTLSFALPTFHSSHRPTGATPRRQPSIQKTSVESGLWHLLVPFLSWDGEYFVSGALQKTAYFFEHTHAFFPGLSTVYVFLNDLMSAYQRRSSGYASSYSEPGGMAFSSGGSSRRATTSTGDASGATGELTENHGFFVPSVVPLSMSLGNLPGTDEPTRIALFAFLLSNTVFVFATLGIFEAARMLSQAEAEKEEAGYATTACCVHACRSFSSVGPLSTSSSGKPVSMPTTKAEQQAWLAACWFSFSAANIHMSAAYTESFFACLSSWGAVLLLSAETAGHTAKRTTSAEEMSAGEDSIYGKELWLHSQKSRCLEERESPTRSLALPSTTTGRRHLAPEVTGRTQPCHWCCRRRRRSLSNARLDQGFLGVGRCGVQQRSVQRFFRSWLASVLFCLASFLRSNGTLALAPLFFHTVRTCPLLGHLLRRGAAETTGKKVVSSEAESPQQSVRSVLPSSTDSPQWTRSPPGQGESGGLCASTENGPDFVAVSRSRENRGCCGSEQCNKAHLLRNRGERWDLVCATGAAFVHWSAALLQAAVVVLPTFLVMAYPFYLYCACPVDSCVDAKCLISSYLFGQGIPWKLNQDGKEPPEGTVVPGHRKISAEPGVDFSSSGLRSCGFHLAGSRGPPSSQQHCSPVLTFQLFARDAILVGLPRVLKYAWRLPSVLPQLMFSLYRDGLQSNAAKLATHLDLAADAALPLGATEVLGTGGCPQGKHTKNHNGIPEWCFARIPNVYPWIQREYWNVYPFGFLEAKKLYLILLSLPHYFLALSCILFFLRQLTPAKEPKHVLGESGEGSARRANREAGGDEREDSVRSSSVREEGVPLLCPETVAGASVSESSLAVVSPSSGPLGIRLASCFSGIVSPFIRLEGRMTWGKKGGPGLPGKLVRAVAVGALRDKAAGDILQLALLAGFMFLCGNTNVSNRFEDSLFLFCLLCHSM